MNKYLFACSWWQYGWVNLPSNHGPPFSVGPGLALALPTAPEPLYEACNLGDGRGGGYTWP